MTALLRTRAEKSSSDAGSTAFGASTGCFSVVVILVVVVWVRLFMVDSVTPRENIPTPIGQGMIRGAGCTREPPPAGLRAP
jgi:hypothetical protein